MPKHHSNVTPIGPGAPLGAGAPQNSKELPGWPPAAPDGAVRRYKVHFWLEVPWDIADEQAEAQIAAAVRTHLRAAKVPPLDNRVHCKRELTPGEARAVIHQHAWADFEAGRLWVCQCPVCAEWRGIGLRVEPPLWACDDCHRYHWQGPKPPPQCPNCQATPPHFKEVSG